MPRNEFTILHLEDSRNDAELIHSMLEHLPAVFTLVSTKNDFLHAFDSSHFDLVLCDYNLPAYDGLSALNDVRKKDPDIPFIFISGTIGEERAIESLKNGATDYVLKGSLARLPSAIDRAIREQEEKKEKRRLDEFLRTQEQFLQKVIETIPAMLIVKDMEGKIQFVNKFTETFFGISSSQIIGKTELELNPNDVGLEQKIKDELELFSGAPSVFIPDDRFVHPMTGVVHHFQTIKVPLTGLSGAPVQILSVSSDITKQKKMEENFLRSERVHNVGALAGGIAHDLNNVLSPILLVMEVLRRNLKDDASLKLLKMVEETTKRGSSLIKQVLSFTRGIKGEKIDFQIKHIVSEVEKIIKQTFPKSIKFNAYIPNDLWVINGDITQFHQVLMNLCVNARDAMPLGGSLHVKGENITIDEHSELFFKGMKKGNFVLLTVTDTGIGIPQEKLGQIFEPFFTTKDIGEGTGLGLSTVKAIVDNHQGFIVVNSQMQRGTVFTIYIPSSKTQNVAVNGPVRKTPLHGNGETILVVDDEKTVVELLRSTLEMSGYSVLTAADGTEAIGTYFMNKDAIKVIMIDMIMPVMDGKTLIDILLRSTTGVRLIRMSGGNEPSEYPDEEHQIPLLKKPFTLEKLLNVLQDVLSAERGLH